MKWTYDEFVDKDNILWHHLDSNKLYLTSPNAKNYNCTDGGVDNEMNVSYTIHHGFQRLH